MPFPSAASDPNFHHLTGRLVLARLPRVQSLERVFSAADDAVKFSTSHWHRNGVGSADVSQLLSGDG